MNSERRYLSVTNLNNLIKAKLEGDFELSDIYLKGEVSNFRVYPSGHAYFSLKDADSTISAIMWSSSIIRMNFRPKDGDEVLVRGKISLYTARGQYSIVCSSMELYGQGNELLKLQMLAKKLQAEGLFDESRKRKLPAFPKAVGLITAKGSAAIKDMVVNLQNRWPMADIYVFPSLVQGKEAPKDLVKAFGLSQEAPIEVLIIGRGGGSSEDLWAFNDEALVRALATSKCPVISAVGHEIDVTLTDYVADKRVSTPTGAAVAAVPDQNEVRQFIDDMGSRMSASIEKRLEKYREHLQNLEKRPFFANPGAIYSLRLEELGKTKERLDLGMNHRIALASLHIDGSKKHLEALSPYGVLGRGYSITTDSNGNVISSIEDIAVGENIRVSLSDGIITGAVEKKEQRK